MNDNFSARAVVLNCKDPRSFRSFAAMLSCAMWITTLELTCHVSDFNSPDGRSFFASSFYSLTDLNLAVRPGGPEHGEIVFAFNSRKYPFLTKLSLDGVAFKATSLGKVTSLELHDFPENQQPMGTFSQFLELLKEGIYLEKLVIDDYSGIAYNDLPTRPALELPRLQNLMIRDAPEWTAQVLCYFSQLPPKVTVTALLGDLRPVASNALLAGLPQKQSRLYQPRFSRATDAKLSFSEGVLQLALHGHDDNSLSLELDWPMHTLGNNDATAISLNSAMISAGKVLALTSITSLECAGQLADVQYGEWASLLIILPGLLNLVVTEKGSGEFARNLFEVIGSPYGLQGPGCATGINILCPKLEAVTLREATYSPALLDAINYSVTSRHQQQVQLKQLQLNLKPSGRFTKNASASMAPEDWRGKLSQHVKKVRIIDALTL